MTTRRPIEQISDRLNPSMEIAVNGRKTAGGMKLRALQNGGRAATRDAIAAAAKLLRAGAEPWREVVARWLACAESDAAIAVEALAREDTILVYPTRGSRLVALRSAIQWGSNCFTQIATHFTIKEFAESVIEDFENGTNLISRQRAGEIMGDIIRDAASSKHGINVYHRIDWDSIHYRTFETWCDLDLGEPLDTGICDIDRWGERHLNIGRVSDRVALVPVEWAEIFSSPCGKCKWDTFPENELNQEDDGDDKPEDDF